MRKIATTVDLSRMMFPNIGDAAEVFVGPAFAHWSLPNTGEVIGFSATLNLTEVHPAFTFPSFTGQSNFSEGESLAVSRAIDAANAYLAREFSD